MKRLIALATFFLLLVTFTASATTRYVNANGTSPALPYTSWATAATNIEDAAVIASSADTILVTNGIYQYGGHTDNGSNRVEINCALQSVNGPGVTIIKGYQIPGTTNGTSAMRCVYMHSASTMSGFTLTNGATQGSSTGPAGGGGGIYMESSCTVSNCVIVGNAAYSPGGAVYGNTISSDVLVNCKLAGNVALYSSSQAGGTYDCTLTNCLLVGNTANSGGAAYNCTLNYCVVSNNTALTGGGVNTCTVNNTLIIGNGNATNTSGGAAASGALNSCTIAGNFSSSFGAVDNSKLANSIIYYNSNNNGFVDCYVSTLTNCCTTIGNGNSSLPNNSTSNAPAFVDMAHGNFHLQIGSPGIDAGTNIFATATDLDGNARIFNGVVDMGAYESTYTNLIHFVNVASTNSVLPFTNWLSAATNIQDAIAISQPGDVIAVASGFYKGNGAVMFGSESNRVVLTNSANVIGIYGAQSTVIVGSFFSHPTRCAYVSSNSVLSGFTLVDGTTTTSGDLVKEQSGGGAWCQPGGVISNCIVGGSDFPYANGATPNDYCTAQAAGGAVYGGTIYNSLLANNTTASGGAPSGGGAAAFATLINCVVTNNSSPSGYAGGLYSGTASNSFFFHNIASSSPIFPSAAGGAFSSMLYSCVLSNNSGYVGGASLCTNYNCTFIANGGSQGGGISSGISYNCLIISNVSTAYGGGANLATLYGCTVISNRALIAGGGASVSKLTNCLVINNSAPNGSGGGVNSSTLRNCLVAGNSGAGSINGSLYNCLITGNTDAVSCVSGGTLYNCTVVSNSAGVCGGIYNATAFNSIIYDNFSSQNPGTNNINSTLNYCITTPLPSAGFNFTNDPAFVNLAGGDYHLSSNSPAINSGNNLYLHNMTNDYDNNPRIVGGTVDVGAYEFQSPVSVISYAWLAQYGLPTDGSADFVDSDGDGYNNWQEWRAGTSPVDATAFLQISSAVPINNNDDGVSITWPSVSGINYFLQRSSDLTVPFTTIATNILGQIGTTTYTDGTALDPTASYFYRVAVP